MSWELARCMYMLQSLTVAALLLPPQTTLDVCHMCKKKITERVSDKTCVYLLFKLMSSSSNQCQVNLPYPHMNSNTITGHVHIMTT